MTTAPACERWMEILREIDTAALCRTLADDMRDRRLTFGGRVLCPFLRPVFIDAEDELRVARAGADAGRARRAGRRCCLRLA